MALGLAGLRPARAWCAVTARKMAPQRSPAVVSWKKGAALLFVTFGLAHDFAFK